MHVLTIPLPTRGVPPRPPPRPLPVTQSAQADYPAAWVAVILLASVCTLPVLALLNARGVAVSAGMVGLIEACILMLCIV